MPEIFDHPYASFLTQVAKPNRYTGAEFGVVRKNWEAVEARVCLAFPDIYDIGMSHLGYRILYKILNDDPRLLAERCYTPWLDFLDKLEEHGLPLCSLETVRPLRDFDVVGFSLQFELTYTNILLMLDKGGIPLRSIDRGESDPLVLAGGPVATHPEPIAPFMDAILIGDGEEAAKEIALSWAQGKKAGKSRLERLSDLTRITGVYVPRFYDVAPDPETGVHVVQAPASEAIDPPPFPIERRLVPDLSAFPFPDDFPVGGPEAIFDRMSIEVARGCTEGCRFCQAGMIYRPVRERDPQEVVDTVLRALKKSGQDEVSLTALSTADVSCISPLIKRLVEQTAPERVSLSVASLRAYGLSEDLLDDIRRVRTSGLTFAPEAGTQRMRDVINKNVTEGQLLETAERVFSRGFDKMKLYFILGLPTETDEDVLGIAQVGKNALAVGKRVGQRPQVTVSVSVHVPKPHTPFQWAQMDELAEVERKQALLEEAVHGPKDAFGRRRKNKALVLRLHDSTTSELEGVLARGDRRLADVVERAYRNGARYDSWSDQHSPELWREALDHFQIDTRVFLGSLPLSARLAWDHIDVGLEDGFLAKEYRKALSSRLSPPCGKVRGAFVHPTNLEDATAEERKLVCYDCGIACDLTRMREVRSDSLRRMGALVPGERARLPVYQGGAAPAGRPELYRPPRPGGPARKYRLRYEKIGPMALLGHLDFIRELPRVVRRAGVRTAYTEGFHPKPHMSFTPALSLGALSLAEFVDIALIDAPSPAELVEALNAAASAGLRFVDGVEIGPDDQPISKVVDEARYVLALSAMALTRVFAGADPEVELERRLRAFAERDVVTVVRDVKGIKRTLDVKQTVLQVGLGGPAAQKAVAQAGLTGRVVLLELGLRIEPTGTARPQEVLEALGLEGPFVAIRTELLGAGRNPLELECHKKPRRSSEESMENPADVEPLLRVDLDRTLLQVDGWTERP